MQDQENNPQKIPINPNTWIILGCIVVLVVVMSTVMFYMMKHVEELRSSPFLYGAKKTSERNGGAGVMCTCMVDVSTENSWGATVRDPYFYFNTTSLWSEKHEPRRLGSDFNASDFKIILANESG